MKKYLIAGGFLIGGYFLIKKILPKLTSSKTEELKLDESESANDVFEKKRLEDERQRVKRERELASQELPKLSRAGGMYTTLPISAIPLPKNSKPKGWTMTPEQLKAIQEAVNKMKQQGKI